TPSSSPVPRLIALSMLSLGIDAFLAACTAERSRGFDSTAPPPTLADIVISLISFVKRRPRFASAAPFLCLIVLHLLWPDMVHLDVMSLGGGAESISPEWARFARRASRPPG